MRMLALQVVGALIAISTTQEMVEYASRIGRIDFWSRFVSIFCRSMHYRFFYVSLRFLDSVVWEVWGDLRVSFSLAVQGNIR